MVRKQSNEKSNETVSGKVAGFSPGRRENIMIRKLEVKVDAPQYVVTTDVAFAQVDAWYGHTRRDLKLDLIYPEDMTGKKYPCIVWICGGAWLTLDKSAHLAYLAQLARAGFAVASVEYRTSNEAVFPAQLHDVKAAIRYLRAHADRYRIDPNRFGVMGESAGGYLSAMAALVDDPVYDVGDYTDFGSSVQAACLWYPPTDPEGFTRVSPEEAAGAPESLLLGKNIARHKEDAIRISPLSYVTQGAPPFLILHGTQDHTVPFAQGKVLYERLQEKGCDAAFLELTGAEHADIRFFQQEVWDEIISFFHEKLS